MIDQQPGTAVSQTAAPDPRKLDEMVKRIVQAVHPQRIILFGSAARGEMGPHSDLDVLVVMPDGFQTRQVAQFLYTQLRGLGYAKDLVVVQECDVTKYADNPYLIIHQALKEGKELYHAAS
jgi:predicted nucleotidyltransferase